MHNGDTQAIEIKVFSAYGIPAPVEASMEKPPIKPLSPTSKEVLEKIEILLRTSEHEESNNTTIVEDPLEDEFRQKGKVSVACQVNTLDEDELRQAEREAKQRETKRRVKRRHTLPETLRPEHTTQIPRFPPLLNKKNQKFKPKKNASEPTPELIVAKGGETKSKRRGKKQIPRTPVQTYKLDLSTTTPAPAEKTQAPATEKRVSTKKKRKTKEESPLTESRGTSPIRANSPKSVNVQLMQLPHPVNTSLWRYSNADVEKYNETINKIPTLMERPNSRGASPAPAAKDPVFLRGITSVPNPIYDKKKIDISFLRSLSPIKERVIDKDTSMMSDSTAKLLKSSLTEAGQVEFTKFRWRNDPKFTVYIHGAHVKNPEKNVLPKFQKIFLPQEEQPLASDITDTLVSMYRESTNTIGKGYLRECIMAARAKSTTPERSKREPEEAEEEQLIIRSSSSLAKLSKPVAFKSATSTPKDKVQLIQYSVKKEGVTVSDLELDTSFEEAPFTTAATAQFEKALMKARELASKTKEPEVAKERYKPLSKVSVTFDAGNKSDTLNSPAEDQYTPPEIKRLRQPTKPKVDVRWSVVEQEEDDFDDSTFNPL